VLDSAVHRHQAGFLRPLDLPRRAERQPVVWLFFLIAVVDLLAEQAVLVIDAVAISRDVERRERVEEAGRETTQAAVAERGVGLGRLTSSSETPIVASASRQKASMPRLLKLLASIRPSRYSIER
jgi:hypothetical protein